ncbi:MAG: hypothetical protein JXA03_11300 [Bacteroidales bacterium]|nr:hypothetical protein [Bacteroidales bacterium]
MIRDAIFIIDENRLNNSGVPGSLTRLTARPFMELWMRFLDQWSFSELLVAGGLWNEHIRNIYNNKYGSFRITYAPVGNSPLLPAELNEAMEHMTGSSVLVIYPDRFFNINVRRLTDFHQLKEAESTVALRFARDIRNDPVVLMDPNYRITGLAGLDNIPVEEYTEGGVFLIKRSLLRQWHNKKNEAFTPGNILGLCSDFRIFGFRCFSEFLDICNPDDLEKAKKTFEMYGY